MKRRFVPAAAAALLTVGVALPLTAKPAKADSPNVLPVLSAINSETSFVDGFFNNTLSLQAAVDQIKAAIVQAQTAIVDQIDLVAAAGVQSCAQTAVIDYIDIDALTTDTLQSDAQDATSCVTMAGSLLPSLTDLGAVDDVGFALETVAPLAIMFRAKAGLSTSALVTAIIAASNTDISRLLPSCHTLTIVERDDLGRPVSTEVDYICTAYNGDSAEGSEFSYAGGPWEPGPIDEVAVQNQATANTSRAAAQTVVASL